MAELVRRGENRGFITYSEILNTFPDIEKDMKGLDTLYEELERRGIEAKESRELLELKEKSDKEKEEIKITSEGGLDPVQMYLKEIGRVSFLSADEEKEFAKRIEKGDEEAKKSLARANLRLVVSIAKKYIAIAKGIISLDEGIIDLPVNHDKKNRMKMVIDRYDGKEAVTHYKVISRNKEKNFVTE